MNRSIGKDEQINFRFQMYKKLLIKNNGILYFTSNEHVSKVLKD